MVSILNRKILTLIAFLCLSSHGFAVTSFGSVTITGVEQSSGSTWDSGTVTVTINGVSISFAYGQFSTPASIASSLGALISENCNMPVYAKATGSTVSFYQKGSNVVSSLNITVASNNPSLFPSNSFLIDSESIWSMPVITGLSLPEGPAQMGFTITGINFTPNASITVTVGGVPATIIGTPTSTQIIVQVPSGVAAGPSSVVVFVDAWPTLPALFTVDNPFPCN